jgi:hypothetical protein
MSGQTSPKSWLFRLRPSLRMLLLLVLLQGGGLGWIAYRARIQRDAVTTIRRAGGAVMYGQRSRPGGQSEFWRPGWLVARLGVDYFDDVTSVILESSLISGPPLHELIRRSTYQSHADPQ